MNFICTIAADGYDDVLVPLSSFQIRYNQAPSQCYLRATIPGILYATEVTDRAAGTIKIESIDSDDTLTELLTANIDTITQSRGAVSRSINIVAYKQTTWPGTGDHTLTNISYYTGSQVRCYPNEAVRPDDQITFEGNPFLVDSISYIVNSSYRQQDITYRALPIPVSVVASPLTVTGSIHGARIASVAGLLTGQMAISGTPIADSITIVDGTVITTTGSISGTPSIGQTYRDFALALSPVAFWPFYDASGTTVAETANNADGTVMPGSSNITWRADGPSPGWTNIGAELLPYPTGPTEDGYVTVVDGSAAPTALRSINGSGNSFTIFGWIKTSKVPNSSSYYFPSTNAIICQLQQKGASTIDYKCTFIVGLTSAIGGYLGFGCAPAGLAAGWVMRSGITQINDGAWHFVAVIVDRTANEVYMYHDGGSLYDAGGVNDYDMSSSTVNCELLFNTFYDQNHSRQTDAGISDGYLYGWGICASALTKAQLDVLYAASYSESVIQTATPISAIGSLHGSQYVGYPTILIPQTPITGTMAISGTAEATGSGLITTNLEGLWLFDEGTGYTVADNYTSNDLTIRNNNTNLWVSDGGAPDGYKIVTATGSPQNGDFPIGPTGFTIANTTDDPFTIIAMASCASYYTTRYIFSLATYDGSYHYEYRFQFLGYALTCQLYDSDGDWISGSATVDLTVDTLYWMAVTYDGSESGSGLTFYLSNSTPLTTTPNSSGTYNGVANNSSNLYVGALHSNLNSAGLGLAHLRFYRRELSSSEIGQIFAGNG